MVDTNTMDWDRRPGLNPNRLLRLMRDAVTRCELNLSNKIVFTEAASGAYVVTPILAAMAGAKQVFALATESRYGTVDAISEMTLALAKLAGVAPRIEIVTSKSPALISGADIITNSGHVRPIDSTMISWMKPSAVIPLMYEAWELRPQDIDVQACRSRGIRIAGTNERHPAINVFSFLGIMAAKLLLEAGVEISGSRILVVCDNPFSTFIDDTLRKLGATAWVRDTVAPPLPGQGNMDAIIWATTPNRLSLGENEADLFSKAYPGAVIVHFWGDIKREAMVNNKLHQWPVTSPAVGHMGILPSGIGPDPIVRLQTGGLKVAEVLSSAEGIIDDNGRAFLDEI